MDPTTSTSPVCGTPGWRMHYGIAFALGSRPWTVLPLPGLLQHGSDSFAFHTPPSGKKINTDDELCAWLTWRMVQKPLAPGLPDTHGTRWSVRITRPSPSEPQGWWDDFTSRWRAYLSSLVPISPSSKPEVIPSSSLLTSPEQPAPPTSGRAYAHSWRLQVRC